MPLVKASGVGAAWQTVDDAGRPAVEGVRACAAGDCFMDFTRNFIRAKSPCADGLRWYLRHHDQLGGYQQILDALVEAGRIDDACWLLDQLGPTNTLLEVDFLQADAVVFAGTIRARGGIEASGLLRAGRSIFSDGGIVAGSDIVAGDEVRSRGAVRASRDLAAKGGLRARWIVVGGGIVSASARPCNLVSGSWCGAGASRPA
ncbi:hypothetical protein EZ313_03290 [Ramlibacter henchirensis]|uniref:Uncharacterized protein n=1 Tax=Ramlibacter henchirensis TaxID=204072 RepID=A0A4Z0C5H3_9BURK|nr:hypothetical protein [Ramlibacter henchirensis]TFZ05700.1 hypothetical protein EZ313_03290 [Ramlibacter henchirensis]